MSKTIVVTGGAGFIGSNFIFYTQKKHRVQSVGRIVLSFFGQIYVIAKLFTALLRVYHQTIL